MRCKHFLVMLEASILHFLLHADSPFSISVCALWVRGTPDCECSPYDGIQHVASITWVARLPIAFVNWFRTRLELIWGQEVKHNGSVCRSCSLLFEHNFLPRSNYSLYLAHWYIIGECCKVLSVSNIYEGWKLEISSHIIDSCGVQTTVKKNLAYVST